MEVINGTRYSLLATEAADREGQPHLLVIAKATYRLPQRDGGTLTLREVAREILLTDVFEGEPGYSSPLIEADLAFRKPACDVVFKGSAHAPGGAPVTELPVVLKLGPIQKTLRVVGARTWKRGLMGISASAPESFTSMPLNWARTFGGMHEAENESDDRRMCSANPVGCGYASAGIGKNLRDTLAPSIEWPNQPIKKPGERYRPAGFGPIGRSWTPRLALAGTYDEQWKEQVFPRLPADFDEAFFQCAPVDQRMPYPTGGEPVTLINLTPGGGALRFALPRRLDLSMAAITRDRAIAKLSPVVDTVLIDTDEGALDIVWRASAPLKRSILEIETLGVGNVCRRWWTSRVYGTDDCGCGGQETDDEDLAPVAQALDAAPAEAVTA